MQHSVRVHNIGGVQVFFPAETSDQAAPPQWFFDQSPSQVKAAFLAKRKKTELDQVCQAQPHANSVDGFATYLQNLLYNASKFCSDSALSWLDWSALCCSQKSKALLFAPPSS